MRKKILLITGILLIVLFGKFVFNFAKLTPVAWQFFFNRDIVLKNTENRVNILLLGIGGGKHEGPNLTDTIIFSSIDLISHRTTLISIPRDLWVPDLRAKINTAYAAGESKQKGGGLALVKAVVSKVIKQPIDYEIRIDFDGFIRATDLVGGLDINVDRAFDDFEYPIEGKENDTCGFSQDEIELRATSSSQLEAFPCRYRHVHFEKGLIHMNGQTALIFVRSRHAEGPEGTDFARSKRQEKVLAAFKNKVFSFQTLLNPIKLSSLYDAFSQNIDTDIKQDEFDDFIKLAQKLKSGQMKTGVIDYGDEQSNRSGLLINPPISEEFGNQWVLVPRVGNGNFEEIAKYVECTITLDNCTILQK